jgi:hypothetical protein
MKAIVLSAYGAVDQLGFREVPDPAKRLLHQLRPREQHERQRPSIDVGEPAGAAARGFVVRAAWTHPDSRRLTELLRAVADGRLAIPIACKVPLAGARQAQTRAEAGAGGKVLLTR